MVSTAPTLKSKHFLSPQGPSQSFAYFSDLSPRTLPQTRCLTFPLSNGPNSFLPRVSVSAVCFTWNAFTPGNCTPVISHHLALWSDAPPWRTPKSTSTFPSNLLLTVPSMFSPLCGTCHHLKSSFIFCSCVSPIFLPVEAPREELLHLWFSQEEMEKQKRRILGICWSW